MRTALTAILLATLFWTDAAGAATLDRIRETGTLKIGYREDAAPYSYTDAVGGPASTGSSFFTLRMISSTPRHNRS